MKILVVDDESDTQQLFEEWYKNEIEAGVFDFTFVSSGELAIDWIEKNKEASTPLLIITDIKMEGIDGFQLLKLMKSNFPHYPIFMLTAYGDDTNFATAKAYGANEFLVKPVAMGTLKEKLLTYKSVIDK